MKPLGVLFVLLGLLAVALWAMPHEGLADSSLKITSGIRTDHRSLKEQIESDLRLEVELKGPKVIEAGTKPWLTTALVNTSKTTPRAVVEPGDSSELGWREPYVYWTATIDCGDGKPVPVPMERDISGCGLIDGDWLKDALLLKPGDKLALGFGPLLEFQQAGRVHLQAHYAYRAYPAGKYPPGKSNRTAIEILRGPLAGVPPFEIISEPVVFDVVRPLDVRVKVKRALKADVAIRLSDLIEVTLVNQSSKPIECSSPTLHSDARLDLEIEGQFGWQSPSLSEQRSNHGIRRKLKPGETVPLLGPGEFANGLDGLWVCPEEGKVRLRVSFMPTTWNGSARILSEWVEVRVEKK